MAERTRVAHSIRGIAWMLTTPADAYALRYPSSFTALLGLHAPHLLPWPSAKLASNQPELTVYESHQWYALLANHLLFPADKLENSYALRTAVQHLRLFPIHDRLAALASITSQIESTFPDPFFNPLSHPERCTAMKLSDKIPQDVMNKLSMSLAGLQASLLNKDPLMPQHLRASHQLLVNYPETVHLLDDTEIAAIIDASEIHTKTQIVADTVKKSAGTKKKIGAADL